VDAQITAAGLIEDFEAHLESGDFEGAEEILAATIIGSQPRLEAFCHYQYGRLYGRWNKLSSAIHHLAKSAELAKLAGDEIFLIQVSVELKAAKDRQAGQKP
jgi:hypothetical protein